MWKRHKKCRTLACPVRSDGAMPLSDLGVGEEGQVVCLSGGRGMLCRMASLGFTPGAEVTMVQNLGHGPLIVRVRGARIALGRGEAQQVCVRRRSA